MTNPNAMTVNEKTGLQPVDANGSIFDTLHGGAIDNFDGDDDNKMRLDLIAFNSKCEDDSKSDGEEFAIKYFSIKKYERINDKTGDVTYPYRTVLIAPDFKTIDFSSDGVAQSLALIVRRKGKGPYDPAIKVIVRVRKMPSKHIMYFLEPVM